MTIPELSEYLKISEATVRNWIKLGKVVATKRDNKTIILNKDIQMLSESLNTSKMLTSRRNKSRLGLNYIPKSYISKKSPNYKTIVSIIGIFQKMTLEITEVISFYADMIMTSKGIPKEIRQSLLPGRLPSKKTKALFSSYKLVYVPFEDTLGLIYISLRRLQDKKATGSYYTPFFAVDLMINELPATVQNICDPACGTGNFLLRLPDSYALESIHGYDIDEIAINIARINLSIKYGISKKAELNTITHNIRCIDFLSNNEMLHKFDIIIGNPPWGSSFTKEQVIELRKNYESLLSKGKPESFDLFVEKAVKSLTSDGNMLFLLPETILGADYHESVRAFMEKNAFVSGISYLGDIFDKVQCPCIILRLNNKETDGITVSQYRKIKNELIVCEKKYMVSPHRINKNSFHILADNEEYKIIEKILSVPHFTLKGQADFALGIVTGSNKSVLSKTPLDGYEGIVKGSDIHKYYYDDPENYTKFAPQNFQQVAPEHMYRSAEKLFYKFIANEPIFAYDSKGVISLNSANILIPRVPGYSALYIMAVLNSRVMAFYYRHTFKNMKMLRSAIESLPIAKCDEYTMNTISSLALEITVEKLTSSEKICQLNALIDNLYSLDKNKFTFTV
ncbi:N-6 DNA Methylase [Butyrivibrio proteoclasticus]|uniref:site-specific DNA-methyltransferase (adenine-specific) n=2 Tax=Butyrivibrio proteoclasticus TaxID=43305 RepID=A0A1I5WJ29_9FIRM|nr:N-6 DNA Methylase [Butyrivibrio proteoclasticus]